MSFQITIWKVLAGHPGGRLSVAELTCCVSILISSGSDWTNRTKRLAARAPALDIFSQSFVLRDSAGWQITEAGRAFLVSIEAPVSEQTSEPVATPMPTLCHKPRCPQVLSNEGTARLQGHRAAVPLLGKELT